MSYDVVDFKKDVIDRSHELPVLVDFWAEWCGPCRILGPVLERLAKHNEGRWELRKVDTERFVEVAADYAIRSIPNVKLFVDGKPVDEFVGALPERAVEAWLAKAVPDERQKIVDHADELLRTGKRADAASLLAEVIPGLPDNERARAMLALATVYENPGRAADLVKDIDSISPEGRSADAVRTIGRLIDIARNGTSLPAGSVRSDYLAAAAAASRQDFRAALEGFIGVVRKDRTYDEDGARKACLAIFAYLGEEHEVTRQFRREFGSALFV
jgi:putative thioredoxin